MMQASDNRRIVETEISVHPELKDRVSKFKMETLNDEISTLPPIKEGDVNISTDYIFDVGDKYEVSIFIRNGLAKPINFEKVPLILVNDKGEILGEKIFNLREVGDIPPKSVRPWKIYFEKEDFNIGDNNLKDLKIVFDTKIKAERTVKVELDNLPEGIQGEKRKKYEKFLEELPLLRRGQVSMSTFDVYKTKDEGVSVVLVICNGNDRAINVEKVPLSIFDASESLVASGVFYLEKVVINPGKANVYRFTFNDDEIINKDMDLSSFKVTFNLTNNISTGDGKSNE